MRRLARTMLALLAIATVAFGRDTPISGGKLVSDLNANGFAITNLPSGFFPAETDPTVPAWAKSPTPPASGITTGDVCAIVTNEVSEGWSEWHYEWYNVGTGVHFPTNFSQITWNGVEWEKPSDFPQFMWPPMEGDITDANVSYFIFEDGLEKGINATRTPITRNALGLARIVDLPPLTNGVPSMISSAAQAATNYTDSATNELARSFSVPDYANVSNAAMNALSRTEAEAGFTEWTVKRNGVDVTAQVRQPTFPDPEVDEWSVEESILLSDETVHFVAGGKFAESLLWSTTEIGSGNSVAYAANRTRLPTMADIPTNTTQLVNGSGYVTDTITNGLASVSSVAAAITNADTTYTRFSISAPTNVNQSVQYINITDENPSVLSVKIPEGTGTKDWLIYVTSQTNVTISLPSATWWLADTSATNDIAPQTPTALYFSQAADGIYTLGRQEFTEVVLP